MTALNARARIVAVLAAALALAGAGCGGGDDGSASSPPTKAEFVKQANALCERESAGVEEKVDSFIEGQRAEKPPGELYADVAQFVLMPVVERQSEGIRALKEPPRDEERIGAMLDANQLAVDKVATSKRIPSLEAVEREFVEAEKLFRSYGLDACANGPGARGGGG